MELRAILGVLILLALNGIEGNVRTRLGHKLFRSYDRNVIPMENQTATVVGKIGLSVTNIRVDDVEQSLTLNAWMDLEWKDYQLTWNPEEFDGITTFRISYTNVWRPDFTLYNAYEPQSMTPTFEDTMVMIQNDGTVFHPISVALKAACPMDLRHFPYDTQICTFKFGSWVYDGYQLDIMKRTEMPDLSNYMSNQRWELTNATVERNVIYYACCPEPFPDVVFKFTIKRRSGDLAMMCISPAVVMAILIPFLFLLPHVSGAKTVLVVGIHLGVFFMVWALQDYVAVDFAHPPIILGCYGWVFLGATAAYIITTLVNAVIGGCSWKPSKNFDKCCSFCGLCLCANGGHLASKSKQAHSDKMAMVFRSETETPPPKSTKEKWHVVASVIDRICFILFSIFVAVGIIYYSMMIPSP